MPERLRLPSRRRTFEVAVVALLLVSTGCAAKSGPTTSNGKTVVKLGVALPLSGPAQSYGLQSRQGILLGAEHANAGLKTYKIEPIFEDSQDLPAPTVTAVQKLISENVNVLFLHNTASILASMPIARRSNLLAFNVSASGSQLYKLPGLINALPLVTDEDTKMAEYAIAHKFDRIGIATIADSFGRGCVTAMTKDVEADGGSVTGVQALSGDTTDASPSMAKLASGHPSAIFLCTYGALSAYVIKAGRQQGFSGQYLSGSWNQIAEVDATGSGAGKGLVSSAFAVDTSTAAGAAYEKEYSKAYPGSTPSSYVGIGYQAVLMLAKALGDLSSPKQLGNVAALTKAVEGEGVVPGPFGDVQVRADGTVQYPLTTVVLGPSGYTSQ